MEIGNALFGNSRGECPVPREEFEEEWVRLIEAYAPDGDTYDIEYENDTFAVMRYWWDACTCGWDSIDGGHKSVRDLEHAPGCYQRELGAIRREVGFPGTLSVDMREERLKPIYQKYGWDTEDKNWWYGYAVRCSCDLLERQAAIYEKYAEELGHLGHKDDCKLVMPNFLYKPTGFSISWYKYPLRDAYMSENLTVEQFGEIIDGCINSLQGN